jgi:hypothetical protein
MKNSKDAARSTAPYHAMFCPSRARVAASLKAGLIDNALPTLAIFFLGVTGKISSVFLWVSGLLTGLFFLLLFLLMPRDEKEV